MDGETTREQMDDAAQFLDAIESLNAEDKEHVLMLLEILSEHGKS